MELSDAERRQVEWLLPAGWARSGKPVPTRLLRRGLEGNGCTLEELLVAVGGQLRDMPLEKRNAERCPNGSDRPRWPT